jgi:hypothetical protein
MQHQCCTAAGRSARTGDWSRIIVSPRSSDPRRSSTHNESPAVVCVRGLRLRGWGSGGLVMGVGESIVGLQGLGCWGGGGWDYGSGPSTLCSGFGTLAVGCRG